MKRRTIKQQLLDSSVPEPNSGCWLWLNHLTWKGYATFSTHEHKTLSGHRESYKEFIGPIPNGLVLDHICRTRSCINPYHLEPVTNIVNIQRGNTGINMRIKTTCPKGHIYDYIDTRGARACKQCSRAAYSKYYRSKH